MKDVVYTQPDANTLRVNTTGRLLEVTIATPGDTNGLGNFSIPNFKNDKAFAFSVGFDDNTNLQLAIDLLDSKGRRGTLYLIGQHVNDLQPNEDWIITHESGSHFWYNVLQHGNGADANLTAAELQPRDRLHL